MHAPGWKDGRPAEDTDFSGDWVERSPHLVKVLRLESYEDSLNALELPEERDARLQGMRDLFGDDYLLKYMLNFETEGCPVLLNTESLERPFDYRLRIHTPDGLSETPVDLVETFNLLMGFHVQHVHDLQDGKRRYVVVEALEDDRSVLVVWRDVTNLDPERERQFLAERFHLEEYANIYTNADSALPNGRSLDAEFHRRMNERDPFATGAGPLGGVSLT
jgi:adenine-specific DNA-methyltransferase